MQKIRYKKKKNFKKLDDKLITDKKTKNPTNIEIVTITQLLIQRKKSLKESRHVDEEYIDSLTEQHQIIQLNMLIKISEESKIILIQQKR